MICLLILEGHRHYESEPGMTADSTASSHAHRGEARYREHSRASNDFIDTPSAIALPLGFIELASNLQD